MLATAEDIAQIAAKAAFGSPLVMNTHRAVIVEAIVSTALPQWEWCSADWAAYDFRCGSTRLEVKQTAAKQPWHSNSAKRSRPQWDVAARTGYYVGSEWTAEPGRNADIYVLAMHSRFDDAADHRDPAQWTFFVVPAHDLPPAAKSIGILVTLAELGDAVEGVRLQFT
jgi:hypothetical protein